MEFCNNYKWWQGCFFLRKRKAIADGLTWASLRLKIHNIKFSVVNWAPSSSQRQSTWAVAHVEHLLEQLRVVEIRFDNEELLNFVHHMRRVELQQLTIDDQQLMQNNYYQVAKQVKIEFVITACFSVSFISHQSDTSYSDLCHNQLKPSHIRTVSNTPAYGQPKNIHINSLKYNQLKNFKCTQKWSLKYTHIWTVSNTPTYEQSQIHPHMDGLKYTHKDSLIMLPTTKWWMRQSPDLTNIGSICSMPNV